MYPRPGVQKLSQMEWEHLLKGEENEMKKFTQRLSHPQVRWENDYFIGASESEVEHYIAHQAMLCSSTYSCYGSGAIL